MMQPTPYATTFRPGERLKRERDIAALFAAGRGVHMAPVRLLYRKVARPAGEAYAIRAGFSAPKKKFPKAVDRNRIKRLLREAWRLQKAVYMPAVGEESQLHLFWIFTGSALARQDEISMVIPALMEKALGRLAFEEAKNSG